MQQIRTQSQCYFIQVALRVSQSAAYIFFAYIFRTPSLKLLLVFLDHIAFFSSKVLGFFLCRNILIAKIVIQNLYRLK